jgi:hypothetical protein
VFPIWPGWKWVQGHIGFPKACGSKNPVASYLLGQCLQESELCFGFKVVGTGMRAVWLPGDSLSLEVAGTLGEALAAVS